MWHQALNLSVDPYLELLISLFQKCYLFIMLLFFSCSLFIWTSFYLISFCPLVLEFSSHLLFLFSQFFYPLLQICFPLFCLKINMRKRIKKKTEYWASNCKIIQQIPAVLSSFQRQCCSHTKLGMLLQSFSVRLLPSRGGDPFLHSWLWLGELSHLYRKLY